jgi:spermidine/putrescine transport system permease protein
MTTAERKFPRTKNRRTGHTDNPRVWFALPYIVFMAVFVVLPLIMLLYHAFFVDGFTFDAVKKYFSNRAEMATIYRSLKIAFISAVLCLAVGYPVAYIITKVKNRRTQYLLLLLLIAPMWINGLLRTVALKNLAGLLSVPNGTGLVIMGLVFDYLPFMVMPVYLVLSNIDKRYTEASADLGANPVITFCKITLPLSAGGIMSGFLMVFTPAVSTYYMSQYLGTPRTFMIGEELNLMFAKNHDYAGASVIALVLLFIVGVSTLLTNRLSRIGNPKGGVF